MVAAPNRPASYKGGVRRCFGANVSISSTTTPKFPNAIKDGARSDLKAAARHARLHRQ
jgi:hypothetical protein